MMEKIGVLVSSKGLRGELRVKFFMDLEWEYLDRLLVEKNEGSYIPHQIEYLKDSGKDDLKKFLKFENINTKEEADALVKKPIYLETAEYEELLPEESWFRLKDYILYDGDREIGEVYDIIEMTQTLFVVKIDDQDVYVPYVEEWIEEIDDEEKTIKMNLPEGILDINN